MNSFSQINGNGTFTLSVDGMLAQRIAFTPEDKSAVTFEIQPFIDNHPDIFAPGSTVIFEMAIETYTQLLNETITNEFSGD